MKLYWLESMLKTSSLAAYALMVVGLLAGSPTSVNATVPAWAENAIWYQIFVERFRNGDPGNDPTLDDIRGAWPPNVPRDWRVTPWGHDWFQQEDWAVGTDEGFYRTVQMRRYGGDIQGVIDQLDYLQQLGVNAIYLNPINDSPSLHKYDARNYRHVDRNFGPDPIGDGRIMKHENPIDPTTWQWTSADQLFLKLIREIHRRQMKIIVDYSWNHTGVTFWAWRDVVENQAASRFADWYDVEQFDDPATTDNEFSYRGWLGVKQLPEFRKFMTGRYDESGLREGNLHPEVKRHVYAVTRRWLDPNGDGDCSDGVDGFRLDVAEHVPISFWREYQEFVNGINPDALLIAELWWDKWPDQMRDPAPWINRDVFHAVMNYRWYAPTRRYFGAGIVQDSTRSYANELLSIEKRLPRDSVQAMMNVAATHDSPRLATSLLNSNKYKFNANPRANDAYRIERPSEDARSRQKLLLVQQFTWIGAPHIYYGDEVGMWGADDPDCRKPMLWADLDYQVEKTSPDGSEREPDVVAPQLKLLEFYRSLIAIRLANHRVLSRGKTTFLDQDDRRLLVYRRSLDDDELLVVINRSDSPAQVRVRSQQPRTYRDLLGDEQQYSTDGDLAVVPVGARQAMILAPIDR